MPASATHTTIAQRLAANSAILLNPLRPPVVNADTTQGIKERFARSDSSAPDFYTRVDHECDPHKLQLSD